MKAESKFESGIFDRSFAERLLAPIVKETAEIIKNDAISSITSGNPAGRVYRRSLITRPRTMGLIRGGFRPHLKTRVIVGANFHRASAPGQPPATDSGQLARSIAIGRAGNLEWEVVARAPYAYGLEMGTANGQPRPFLAPALERAKPEFEEKVARALLEAIR